jgi:hypothetical protein
MSLQVSINGHGASISIEVSGYERLSAQDVSDANWLKCRVAVNLGCFTGDYPTAFETSDFVRFRDGLKTVLSATSGSASFLTCEEALSCTIEMKKNGTARIKGVAQAHGHTTSVLSFSFESDQSFLAKTLRELESVAEQFPVRQKNSRGQIGP